MHSRCGTCGRAGSGMYPSKQRLCLLLGRGSVVEQPGRVLLRIFQVCSLRGDRPLADLGLGVVIRFEHSIGAWELQGGPPLTAFDWRMKAEQDVA